MEYRIFHSSLAETSFLQNIDYLERKWTIHEIKTFLAKTSHIIEILKVDPFVFPIWEPYPKIRKVIILKQITMFYEIVMTEVHIHLFWNNYQDPEKIKEFLL